MAEALADTPVVVLTGPRQAGKTNLVGQRAVAIGLRYLTLNNELTRLSAWEDPVGLVRNMTATKPYP